MLTTITAVAALIIACTALRVARATARRDRDTRALVRRIKLDALAAEARHSDQLRTLRAEIDGHR